MPSQIEKAARDLAASASNGIYDDEHIINIIKAVQECDSDPDDKKAEYRKIAKELQKDGELEIDDDAIVSISEDGGAYVQAWVWVR